MMNMKGREAKGAPSADLLVCFPSRAHLTLRPKLICSPARPSESAKRHHHNHQLHPHHHHHLKKSSTRGTSSGGGGSQASPMLWAKNKQMGSDNSEPTSPKVTCAGQIRVRHKANPCKSWQSVMEEIERIHKNRNKNKQSKKKSIWSESFGFKKDVLQFLTCLRNIKFDFRCFGSFPQAEVINSDDEDEDDEEEQEEEDEYQEYQENQAGVREEDEGSRTVFSKWYMVLQENQNSSRRICINQDIIKEKERHFSSDHDQDQPSPAVPPPNALLLMRCRSAPAKSWLEEKQEEEEKEKENDDEEEEGKGKGKGKGKDVNQEIKKGKNLKTLMEEEERNSKKENLVVMKYDTDEFYQISSDIVKETWVVGGMKDLLSRSKSWKR